MHAGALLLTDNTKSARVRTVAGRIAAVVLLAGLATVAGQKSMAMVLAERAPDRALRFDATNAAAHVQKAMDLVSGEDSSPPLDRVAYHSQQAILTDATQPSAAVGIGLVQEQQRKQKAATAAFAYAQALSRRNFPAQLWLIEDAVRRDDIPAALRHYDIAMRTSRASKTLLFPVLTNAIGDPAIVPPLAKIIAANPVWQEQFVQHAAQNAGDLDALASLLGAIRQNGGQVSDQAISTALSRFMNDEDVSGAWKLYASMNPQDARKTIRGGRFVQQPNYPSPFDWRLSDDGEAVAEPRQIGAGTALYFAAPMDWGGTVASQTLHLSPGQHSLTGMAYGILLTDGQRPFFTLRCLETADTQRFELPRSDEQGKPFRWQFTIPSNCSFQSLQIELAPANTPEGVEGYVSNLSVTE